MKLKIYTLILILVMSYISGFALNNTCLDRWEEFSHTPEKTRLMEWMKETARGILLKKNSFTNMNISLPSKTDCTGLFVTLMRKGKVRGCYGAFSHTYGSSSHILGEYIKGALSLDPRHKPLERHELDDTEIILTVTSNPEPVDDINNVDISNFGVFIDCDDSAKTVIVPAEFRTTYSIMKFTGNPRCRIYKFQAVTIR